MPIRFSGEKEHSSGAKRPAKTLLYLNKSSLYKLPIRDYSTSGKLTNPYPLYAGRLNRGAITVANQHLSGFYRQNSLAILCKVINVVLASIKFTKSIRSRQLKSSVALS